MEFDPNKIPTTKPSQESLSYSEQQKEDMITGVQNWEELSVVLEEIGPITGSNRIYTSDDLSLSISNVRGEASSLVKSGVCTGDITKNFLIKNALKQITNACKLRDTVERLLKFYFNKQ